jgi:hypothetical protein
MTLIAKIIAWLKGHDTSHHVIANAIGEVEKIAERLAAGVMLADEEVAAHKAALQAAEAAYKTVLAEKEGRITALKSSQDRAIRAHKKIAALVA